MHSRIFQLKTSPSVEDATFFDIPESFNAYADYWDVLDCDPTDDIDALKQTLADCGALVGENSVTIGEQCALNYFAPRLENIKRFAKALTEITLRQFAGRDTVVVPYTAESSYTSSVDSLVYHLKANHEDTGGYWVIVNDTYNLMTLDEFMRMGRTYFGTDTFFFGTVFDYHY